MSVILKAISGFNLSCQVVQQNGILHKDKSKNEKGVIMVAAGKKRVQRLKKIIVMIVVVLLILPSIFCIILVVKVGNLERQVEDLKKKTDKSLEIVWSNDESLITDNLSSEDTIDSEEVLQEEEKKIRKVYLTFDDGPSSYTKDILDILKRYNVKATFFVTGMNLQYDECLQEILDDGHSLGLHTFSHVYSDIYNSLDNFKEDFNKVRDYVYLNTGEKINLYRFPGGSANNVVSEETRNEILAWLKKEGIIYFDWNVYSGDAENQLLSAEEIADNCIKGVEECNTAIVLLHDSNGKKSTIEALPLIIEGINQLDDTMLLPMDEETVTIQQIRLTEE